MQLKPDLEYYGIEFK